MRSIAMAVTAALLTAHSAQAEGMLDLYIGGAFTKTSELEFDTTLGNVTFPEVGWEDSFALGIRGGGWFSGPGRFIGLAADLSYFNADVDRILGVPAGGTATFHMITLTPLVMVRFPLLTDEDFVGGRIAPYAAIGPGLYTSIFTTDASNGADGGFDVGLDARVGIATQIVRHFGLFAEWRRTDVNVSVKDDAGDKVKAPLKTDHFNVGIALRF